MCHVAFVDTATQVRIAESKDEGLSALEAIAEEILRSDITLTRERAIDIASQVRPDLVPARVAPHVEPERVERAAAPMPGAEEFDVIERGAVEVQTSDPSLTLARAIDVVSTSRPELVHAYRVASGAARN
jgi:hypothetical protein